MLILCKKAKLNAVLDILRSINNIVANPWKTIFCTSFLMVPIRAVISLIWCQSIEVEYFHLTAWSLLMPYTTSLILFTTVYGRSQDFSYFGGFPLILLGLHCLLQIRYYLILKSYLAFILSVEISSLLLTKAWTFARLFSKLIYLKILDL